MRSIICLLLALFAVQSLAIVHRPRADNRALNIPTEHSVFEASIDAKSAVLSHVNNEEIDVIFNNLYSSETPEGQPKTCAPCVKNGTMHIIEELWKAKIDECANKTGKRAEWCQWIKDHPKFYTGFLFAKYHPVYQSFLYCSGAEKCKIHGGCNTTDIFASSNNQFSDAEQAEAVQHMISEANIRSGLSASTSSFDTIKNALHPSNRHWMHFNEAKQENMIERMMHSGRRVGRHVGHITQHSQSNNQSNSHHMSGRCANCLKLTIEGELAADFVCINLYCASHDKDPKISKMCKCIEHNLAFTAGYLYGYTQPYKFSIGYCLGSGTCSVGDFMNGGKKGVI